MADAFSCLGPPGCCSAALSFVAPLAILLVIFLKDTADGDWDNHDDDDWL